MKLRSIIGLLMLAAATWASGQTTIYVATTGSDLTGDGTAGNPFLTISNAVAQAEAADVVLVATGRYELSSAILISKAVTVRSWNAGAGGVEDRENTILDGNMVCAPLRFAHASAWASGFTITRGNGFRGYNNNFGGGVLMAGGILSNCIVKGNMASHWGGGIYMEPNANALVVDCIVRDNYTTNTTSWGRGGGIFMRDDAGAIIKSSVISNQSFASGGGIHASASTVISNCFVASNQLSSTGGALGGGIHVAGTNVLLVDCTISNNTSALVGGGVSVAKGGFADVLGTTIVDNQARVRGGGFQADGAFVSNCVIRANRLYEPSRGGAGVACGYINQAGAGTLTVVDTRIIDNGLDSNTQYGGGVWIYTHGTAAFYNCEITSNSMLATSENSRFGAGMYIGTGSAHVVVQNCLIAGNKIEGEPDSKTGSGGGVYLGSVDCANSGPSPLALTIQSCTITDNSATRDYGGMYLAYNATEVTVLNTIVASNCADRYHPDLHGEGDYRSSFSHSCAPELTNVAQGNITNAPLFAGYDAGNYRMAQGSPCVNAGTNLPWMADAVDLDGRCRLDRFSRQVDMGCYEYLPQGMILNLR
ncbi:MAG: right-handed parallel beta-helix repeat-containing protein [Kiritimatiellia bacterium]